MKNIKIYIDRHVERADGNYYDQLIVEAWGWVAILLEWRSR